MNSRNQTMIVVVAAVVVVAIVVVAVLMLNQGTPTPGGTVQIPGTSCAPTCKNQNWSSVSAAGLNVSGYDFTGTTIIGGSFSSGNISRAKFVGAQLKGTATGPVSFATANASGADFTNAVLCYVTFNGATKADTATWTGAKFFNVTWADGSTTVPSGATAVTACPF